MQLSAMLTYVKMDFHGITKEPGDAKHCSQILPISDVEASLSGNGEDGETFSRQPLTSFGMWSCKRVWDPGIPILSFASWLHSEHMQVCLATNPNQQGN